jgi:hypothetical protein
VVETSGAWSWDERRVVEMREHAPGRFEPLPTGPRKILGPPPFNKKILQLNLHMTRVVAG